MGLSCKAQYFCEVTDVDELKEAISWANKNSQSIMILGGGSNVLFTKDYEGLIIHNQIKGKITLQENNELVHLYIGSGENWHELVSFTTKKDWYGIENLALIPGLVGAAPIQNIGAYGVEIKDVLVRVHALNIETLEEESFTNAECEFSYRYSIFKGPKKGKYVIFGIEILLNKEPKVQISYGDIEKKLEENGIITIDSKAVFDAVIQIRKSKLPDPAELGNTGSFFKNPIVPISVLDKIKKHYKEVPSYPMPNNEVKIPAGWLIEQRGWKGKVVGNTGNHAKQALVIVNYGNATGQEIEAHAISVIKDVKEHFGIELEAEVNIIS